MHTYIVRVYRAHPDDVGTVSGIIEDIDLGQTSRFLGMDELQTMLADAIIKAQPGPPGIPSREIDIHEKVAMAR